MNPSTEHPGDPLRRPISSARWSARFALAVAILGVLAWAWRAADMSPLGLWEGRERVGHFIFGRQLADDERARLLDQAARDLTTRYTQEALAELRRAEPEASPGDLLPRAQSLAQQRLAALPESERQAEIQRRLERLERDSGGGFFPPATDPEKLRAYADALLETIAIAIWGSLLAVVAAVPASLLASRRSLDILLPGDAAWRRWARRSAHFATRRSFDFCRGFNEYVMALLFVVIVGLGPFAGVLALFVHTFGVLGKVFAEAFEAADAGPVDGIVSTGAGPIQTVSYALFPQAMPVLVSQSLLRFESNVRSATVLGVCGAGGIGFLLSAKIGAYEWREVCTMMIMIIIVVSLIDSLCSAVMKRFI